MCMNDVRETAVEVMPQSYGAPGGLSSFSGSDTRFLRATCIGDLIERPA